MSLDPHDFRGLMGPIATCLMGEPSLPSRTAPRYGNRGSLAIDLRKDTWFDHEQKVGGGVLDFIERETGLAGGDRVAWLKQHGFVKDEHHTGNGASYPPKPKPSAGRKAVASYDYFDEAGTLLMRVVRYEPRDFRQCRPDGAGGWLPNISGVRLVPYRLPALLEAIASDHPVFVVEGEKDCDNLAAIGVVATTNPMGAKKWPERFAEYLRDADVILIPDNDSPGREHVADVAARLAPVARRVRVLELPGLPAKGDASDWLAAGGTAERLYKLAEAARPWEPAVEADDVQQSNALGEWDAGDDDWVIPPRGWLLGNVFCRTFVSSLIADGGVGKTALRIGQLLSLASGRELTGEHVFARCRVQIVSLEDDRHELRRRVRAAMLHYGITNDDIRGWLYLATPGLEAGKLMALNDKGRPVEGDLAARLTQTIVSRKIDIVSLDPFVKTHRLPENDNSAMDAVIQILASLATKHDLAVDIPHHTSKGASDPGNANRGRGASAVKDGGRLVYSLACMSAEEAAAFSIPEGERRLYIRMDSAKVNISPPMTEAKWFRLVGVPLGNTSAQYPGGDNVQVVELWSPPETWAGLSNDLLNCILTEIDTGMPDGTRYSAASKAGERAVWPVIAKHAPDKTEKQCRWIIRAWTTSGLLVTRDYQNPVTRKPAKGLWVIDAKRPGTQL